MRDDNNTPMPTAKQFYDRVVWDPRFDPERFTIAYEDRCQPTGLQETPLRAWSPTGDVPWHRVRRFCRSGAVVWDRAARVCLLTPTEPAPTAKSTARDARRLPVARPTQRVDGAMYAFSDGAWRPSQRRAQSLPERARLATFNALNDARSFARSDARSPLILEALEVLDADLIALQEVSPELLEALLSCGWVRAGYLASAREPDDVKGHGMMALSRTPVTLEALIFSPQKRALIIRAGGWCVADIHLTSDCARNAPAKRAAQLAAVLDVCDARPTDVVVILGDFNERARVIDALTTRGFADAWTALRPGELGETFDPGGNALAALMSSSGQAARFDRVACRGAHALTVERFAEPSSPRDLPASDHAGLSVTLAPGPAPRDPVIAALGEADEALTAILETLRDACELCAGPTARLQLFGSRRLGVADLESDVDLVCVGPTGCSRDDFFERMRDLLEGVARDVHLGEGLVPALQMSLESTRVDLLYAAAITEDGGLSPRDTTDVQVLQGLRAAPAIERAVAASPPGLRGFRALLRRVRAWARARAVRDGAWGFLGAHGWAVLVAWVCQHHVREEMDLEATTRRFFSILSGHDWTTPIALDDGLVEAFSPGPHDVMPVLTVSRPVRNVARGVTRRTHEVLIAELKRAARILSRRDVTAAWGTLLEPPTIGSEDRRLTLRLDAAEDAAVATGRLRGRALGLLLALEGCPGITGLRPFPAQHERLGTTRVGLRGDLDEDAILDAARCWAEGLERDLAGRLSITLESPRIEAARD